MRKFIRIVDAISESLGKSVRWLSVALVALVCYEVIMRFVFNRPSLWQYEVVAMLGATLYSLAFAYVLLHRANIRVDVIYSRIPRRSQAIIDSVGALVAFFPLMVLVVMTSINATIHAWVTDEKMAFTGWYPPAGPLRTVMSFGFLVLLLQGIAQFIKDSYFLLRNKAYD